MDAMIPVIMGAWVVFALWLTRDGWRHARWAARSDPYRGGGSDGGRDGGFDGGRGVDSGEEMMNRAHGVLLATARFAAAAGLLAVVTATVFGADLLWLALAPPVIILVAGLAGHVGTRWLVHRSDPASGSLPEGS